MCKKLKRKKKMSKVMNNSIFRSMMRIIMIVLYYHQHKKLHAVQSWKKKGKVLGLWTDGQTEALIHR